jgi:hypothetical protein
VPVLEVVAKLMRSPKALLLVPASFTKCPDSQEMRISSMEIHCDPNTDPIKPFLNLAGTNAVLFQPTAVSALLASATSKSKLMPFIYFTAKTSQEPVRLGALLLELCDTRGYNRRQRDKLPGILYPEQSVAHETGTSAAPNT